MALKRIEELETEKQKLLFDMDSTLESLKECKVSNVKFGSEVIL